MAWELSFALILFAVTAVGGGVDESQGLLFSIQTDKTVYQTGDPITLKMELKNTNKTTLRINRNFVLHTDLRPLFTIKSSDKDLAWLPPSFPAEVNAKSFVSLALARASGTP